LDGTSPALGKRYTLKNSGKRPVVVMFPPDLCVALPKQMLYPL
jgi:hypothetical protein